MTDESATEELLNLPRFREVVDILGEGVLFFHLGSGFVYANAAALRLHDVDETARLGGDAVAYKDAFDFFRLNGTPLPEGDHPLERLQRGEAFAQLELELRPARAPRGAGRDGAGGDEDEADEECGAEWTATCVSAQGVPIDGEVVALVLTDITDRVEAERAFDRSFQTNPAPALVNRISDLRFVKVNEGFLEMTGYGREEIVGRTAYEFDVLAGAHGRERMVEKMHRGEKLPQTEASVPTKSGERVPVIVAGMPLELEDEPCMMFTFAALVDLKRTESALQRSEERFSRAFRLAPLPVFLSDEEGRFLNVNDAFVELTGFDRPALLGRTARELELWSADDQATLDAALADGRGVRDLEVTLQTSEGEARAARIDVGLVPSEERDSFLGMLQDVSERKRNEEELLTALEAVMADTSWFSQAIVEKLAQLRSGRVPAAREVELADLTRRERQVLERMVQGWKNARIAEDLGIAEVTARNHVARVYEKIGVHSRVDAVLWARKRGLGAS